jgi:hypothetical protein
MLPVWVFNLGLTGSVNQCTMSNIQCPISNFQVGRVPGVSRNSGQLTGAWPGSRVTPSKIRKARHPPHLEIGNWTLDIGH